MHYVGIDIAKRKHVAFTLDSEGTRVGKALDIANDRNGFDKLLTHLGELKTEVTVGLEATGHYWLALYNLLVEADYQVIVLNPLQVQAYRKSGIRKRKDDRYDAFWVAELVREQLLAVMREELPHSIATRVTEWEWPYIRCEILVERESQKGMVIGKGGRLLKKVGEAVRAQLVDGAYLDLQVKVDKDWQRSPDAIERLGY